MARTLIVHTTESNSSPGAAQRAADFLRRANKMSHQVYDPVYDQTAVLLPWDAPERTLKNLVGGVQTNNRPGTFQVEIVGWARQTHLMSDRWYRNLADYLHACCVELGVPWVFPVQFLSASYADRHINRLSFEEWLRVDGVIGHCHVPENDHWDPGLLDVERLLRFTIPEPEEDPDMRPLVYIITDGPHFVRFASGRVAWVGAAEAAVYDDVEKVVEGDPTVRDRLMLESTAGQ